jgi:tRNA nucleotidyltransferase/poly(A) polymerase
VLPRDVDEVVARLRDAGVPAWVVGGALRDLRLGRPVRDVDLLVGEPLERAAGALPDARRVAAHTPLLLLRTGAHTVEISALRGGARSVEEDLRLRDFTVNALALDPASGDWIDPLGGGSDLALRRLRATDPARTFRDDPVRVLRGAVLEVELELSVDPATLRAMERDSWRIGGSAGERVRDALLRLLALPGAARGLERLRRVGALAAALPEALRGVGIEQSRHHVEDVHRHTLRVIELSRADPELRLAALLHDAAKVDTKRFVKERDDFRFVGHERAALRHVRSAAARLRLSRVQTDRIARLVAHHLLFPDRLATDAAIRRMLARVGRDILDPLLELRRADYASRHQGLAPPEWSAAEARIRAAALRDTEPALAIGGGDVMRELGLGPGPGVGRWLRRARARIALRPAENTRARLLAWLRAERGEDA